MIYFKRIADLMSLRLNLTLFCLQILCQNRTTHLGTLYNAKQGTLLELLSVTCDCESAPGFVEVFEVLLLNATPTCRVPQNAISLRGFFICVGSNSIGNLRYAVLK